MTYEIEQRAEKTTTARFPERRMIAAVYFVLLRSVVIEMDSILGLRSNSTSIFFKIVTVMKS